MATAATLKLWELFWIVLFFCVINTSGQQLGLPTDKNSTICKNMFLNSIKALRKMENCVVVMGNVHVLLMERSKKDDFKNISFPNLREITGFLMTYRVRGLDSLGRLFPNLARIRGETLFYDYSLIIHDMANLETVGLYSLVKIDRGGVIIWGGPQTCYVDTINWQALAPNARHVLNKADKHAHCSSLCTCSRNASVNHCWSIRKCQRFLDGPEGEKCNPECLGCRLTNPNECSVCRHNTYKGQCVPKCPEHTLLLPSNQYCITIEECRQLSGWSWNHSCVFECPSDYVKSNDSSILGCAKCLDCQKTCGNLTIQTLDTVQAAERCVFVNGSLIIHVRAVPYAMEELRTFLGRIQEVRDFIVIYGSIIITSLDFLPSLRRIRGQHLTLNKYSLVIHDMTNTQTLFTPNVTENLQVDKGSVRIFNNPMLCTNQISKLKRRFPVKPSDIDIPPGMNGYSAGCKEVSVGLKVKVINETSALVMFSPLQNPRVSYTILYVRLPPRVNITILPETCSESEWFALPVDDKQSGKVELTDLSPASTYAVCIETFNLSNRNLARTRIVNFTTTVGKPEPPFISELVASSSEVVVLRWVNHRLYKYHITHYELDVKLIEIDNKDVFLSDHCRNPNDEDDIDPYRHATVMRPPPQYERGCESMCGVLSSVTFGAMVEEHFDICSSLEQGCDGPEADPPSNSTYKEYVKSLFLNISEPTTNFQVAGLAPFRDYRFRLRACCGELCSRSARGVVRTLRSKVDHADVPLFVSGSSINSGLVNVEWKHPSLINGAILSYFVQVKPKVSENGDLWPQMWCIPSNETSYSFPFDVSSKLSIRVCSSTLAFTYACSEWTRVEFINSMGSSLWWAGIIFGILIYLISFAVGFVWRTRKEYSDNIPLVDYTSMCRSESEPPFDVSDFTPFYLVHLNNPD